MPRVNPDSSAKILVPSVCCYRLANITYAESTMHKARRAIRMVDQLNGGKIGALRKKTVE